MSRILLFGGSFNPPHIGHVHALTAAADALAPERIFLIPAAEPPHKTLAEGSPSAEERLEMTRKAFSSVDSAEVLDIEIRRDGPSYTSDTLRALSERFPDHELIFLVGTDMFLTLAEWHEPEVITRLSSIAVMARETGAGEKIRKTTLQLETNFGARIYQISADPVEISSTDLRALLKDRKGRQLLPDEVYSLIIRYRYYDARPEFEWLRQRAYSYLKPKRVAHVRGVEQTAVLMAQQWGVPPEDAAEAAICHDITKKFDQEEQLRLCAEYGIMTDEKERTSDKLLHARTGAAFAKDLFGVSDEVASAIRWHTTGRAAMTDLERITYLADYTEPNRSGFPGLSELRTACGEDLDAAMELAARMSLDEVRGKGQEPHEYTLQCRAYYRKCLLSRGMSPIHAEGIPDDI